MPKPITNGKCDCPHMHWPNALALAPGQRMECGTCKRVLYGPAGAQGFGGRPPSYVWTPTGGWAPNVPTPPVKTAPGPTGSEVLGKMLSALEKAGVIKEAPSSTVGFYGETPKGSPIVKVPPTRCPDCLKTPGRYEGFRDAGFCRTCDGTSYV